MGAICWNAIKADQHHAELKDVLSTIQNDLIHDFIDRAILSFSQHLLLFFIVCCCNWW